MKNGAPFPADTSSSAYFNAPGASLGVPETRGKDLVPKGYELHEQAAKSQASLMQVEKA